MSLKIHGFSLSWFFLVSRILRGQPILGADFISKTKMVRDLGRSICYFAFAPLLFVKLIQRNDDPPCSQTISLYSRLPHVPSGTFSPSQRGKLEQLITQYPDVLTEKLGLTHLMDYQIQLLETTAVRLAPCLIVPPPPKCSILGGILKCC